MSSKIVLNTQKTCEGFLLHVFNVLLMCMIGYGLSDDMVDRGCREIYDEFSKAGRFGKNQT